MRQVTQIPREPALETIREEEFAPSLTRMAAAVLALVGIFISAYLALYKLGYLGALQCGPAGGCEVVQASEYAVFLVRLCQVSA